MSADAPPGHTAPGTLALDGRADARLAGAAERVLTILEDAIGEGFPAGATLVLADAGGQLLKLTAGWSCVVGERIATSPDTRYDLASLTKVVCTVPLVVALAEHGVWSLDDALARRLDGFLNPNVTLRQLLTHTSGLPAHRKFYLLPGGPEAMRAAVYAEAGSTLGAGTVCYSDLGFMLLGWALEQNSGLPLDELFQTTIAAPLQMDSTRFCPPASERDLIAATEFDGDQRPTPGLVWGEVHDGNAWGLGGVAGHAGLFGTADDLARYARALLTPTAHPVLSAVSIAEMTRLQVAGPPDARALGWCLDAGAWGPWPPSTFWHTGFTGTSLLIAPELGVAVVLLMGGVHPVRQLDRQAELRASVHRELLSALT